MEGNIFDSEILNDALAEKFIRVLPNDIIKMGLGIVHNFNSNSIVVEVFPMESFKETYDKLGFGSERRKMKDRILYRLKKEGFQFISIDGITGHYVKKNLSSQKKNFYK